MFILRFIGRGLRRLLAIVVLTLIRGRRAVAIVAGVLVVGWVLVANASRLPIPAGAIPQLGATLPAGGAVKPIAAGKTSTISAEAVMAVNDYIKGLTQFDAQLMWGALAEEAINGMKARGGSLEALQSGLDDAKRRGARYEDITMIGNYPLQDGRKYLFYVLSRRGFSGPDQLEQVYFVFTVDKAGKITRIE